MIAHRFYPWLIVVTLAALVAACHIAPAASEVETPDTGVITVYTALEADEVAAYLPDFQLSYPEIQVNLVRAATDILSDKILAEKDDPQADVIWGMPLTSMLLFEWKDLLKPYAPVGLDQLDTRFRDTRKPPYWVGANLALSAFCVNADAAARRGFPIPHSWQDLLNPLYRRSLVMPNPTTSGAGLMAILGILELYGEQDGWRYLDELHKNIAVYTPSGAQACQLVDRAEYAIGIAQTVEGLANVQMIYPTEGSGWELAASALVRKDPIHPAAKTFLDWSISKSAMQLYARKSAVTGMKTGMAIPLGFPTNPDAQLLKKDIPWAAANRDRILTEWLRRYNDKVPVTN